METKFKVGDVIIRSAYRKSSSKLMRDEQKILAIVSDEHPIKSRVWYITRSYKGELCSGLQFVIEDCFEKLSSNQ